MTKDSGTTILLAIGEPRETRLLSEALAFHDYRSLQAGTGAEALALVQEAQPDLIVLDLVQADVDGLVLCADLRARTRAPIIALGAPDDRQSADQRRDALLAFRLGADDFVARPFDVDDVVARVEAQLRRVAAQSPAGGEAVEASAADAGAGVRPPEGAPDEAPPARTPGARPAAPTGPARGRATAGKDAGDLPDAGPREARVDRAGTLTLDHTHHRVLVGDREVKLSRSEYLLLAALMSRPDELLSRIDLAKAVWGEQLASVGRPIDQHMYRLRSKLHQAAREAGVQPPSIVSVPGFGYRLTGNDQLAAAS